MHSACDMLFRAASKRSFCVCSSAVGAPEEPVVQQQEDEQDEATGREGEEDAREDPVEPAELPLVLRDAVAALGIRRRREPRQPRLEWR